MSLSLLLEENPLSIKILWKENSKNIENLFLEPARFSSCMQLIKSFTCQACIR